MTEALSMCGRSPFHGYIYIVSPYSPPIVLWSRNAAKAEVAECMEDKAVIVVAVKRHNRRFRGSMTWPESDLSTTSTPRVVVMDTFSPYKHSSFSSVLLVFYLPHLRPPYPPLICDHGSCTL